MNKITKLLLIISYELTRNIWCIQNKLKAQLVSCFASLTRKHRDAGSRESSCHADGLKPSAVSSCELLRSCGPLSTSWKDRAPPPTLAPGWGSPCSLSTIKSRGGETLAPSRRGIFASVCHEGQLIRELTWLWRPPLPSHALLYFSPFYWYV